MQHRTVQDVMTHEVVTVRRDTPFKTVAELLAGHDVTAVPVVDGQHRPIGIVSEADLLRKESVQPEPGGRDPIPRLPPRDRARAEAETAEGLMSTMVFTARPDWSVVEAARVMDRQHVKRLPVVDDSGVLVGVVSRSDLLRVFLRHDTAIREEIVHDVLERTLFLAPDAVRVEVVEGVVTLRGKVERRSTVPIVLRLCRTVDGVVAVHDNLSYSFDDRRADVEPETVHGIL
ncbi:CBS-domain-containing membrane protein [Streptacidiphilus sp. MAP12-16]|uniref:CBS domain-containing protein n=1 Tax=Streptacidiphilus sp. MAP12-16 TaxID=3156300 RepID=UPI0035114450